VNNNDLLPSGWTHTELGVILPLQYGKALREDDRNATGSFAVYGSSGLVGKHSIALTKGASIIVGRKGNVGATYFSPDPCWPIDTVYFIDGTPSTNLKFFSYLLTWLGLVRLDRSTAVPGLSRDDYSPLRVPMPPATEQKRIVEAIESYLTKLDAAVAALERVRANLKRYRASVLKAAVEGRLVPTEAELARKEGRDFEPASVLLDRILAERRRRWEESELARMKAAGKPPKDDRWKSKYKEPVTPDSSTLPHLPDGWCWATVEQLGEVSGGLTKNQTREKIATRLPYLRVANVYTNELRLDEIFDIGVESSEVPRVRLQPGDLLVVEGNGSSDQIGRVALWDGSIDPCVHQNHLIKVRFWIEILSRWTLNWLMSPAGRSLVSRAASSTSGLNTLSISKVARLSVPLAPLSEQARAITELERRESVITEAIETVTKSEKRTARLRQSILKRAFEGKLVDQDPSDQPASLLLETIRAERAAAAPYRKPKKLEARHTEAAK
jgi:type I restriction enzyme S subunit